MGPVSWRTLSMGKSQAHSTYLSQSQNRRYAQSDSRDDKADYRPDGSTGKCNIQSGLWRGKDDQ